MKRTITIEINAENRDPIYFFAFRLLSMLRDMEDSGQIKEYSITID